MYGNDVLRDDADVPGPGLSPDRLLIGEFVMGSLAGTLTAEPATSAEDILAEVLARRDEDRTRALRQSFLR